MKPRHNKRDDNRFEFKLTSNGHIICQRFFAVNNFNKANLTDVKDLMDSLTGMNNNGWGDMGIIPTHLKRESEEYLWRMFKPYDTQLPENIDRRDVFENEDIIGFELNYDGRLIAKSAFSGNFFPPKVRYNISIRDIIPEIYSEVREHLSA
jgi:hypothetical protein